MKQSPTSSLRQRLAGPVDGASVAVFRMAFGAIMCCEVLRYVVHGWIARYYIQPGFHFTYFGFGWVQPWPGWGMYVHFALLFAAALLVSLGRVAVRISARCGSGKRRLFVR
jgi:vitamin K-dependent gamma-carboxylase